MVVVNGVQGEGCKWFLLCPVVLEVVPGVLQSSVMLSPWVVLVIVVVMVGVMCRLKVLGTMHLVSWRLLLIRLVTVQVVVLTTLLPTLEVCMLRVLWKTFGKVRMPPTRPGKLE